MCNILEKLPKGSKLIDGTSYYYVNSNGVVTKLTKKGYKMVNLVKHTTGWLKFYIYEKDKKRELKFLHKVVAGLFIPNPNNYRYIKMKDGDRSNVCIDNMEWCTYHDVLENTRKYGYTNPNVKAKLRLTNEQIISLIKDLNNITKERYCYINLAKKYNITVQLLAKVRKKECYRDYWEIYGSKNYSYKSNYSTKFNKNNALMLIRDIVSYDKLTKEDLYYICNKYNITLFRLWNIRKQKVYKDIWNREEFKNYKYQTIYGKDKK